MWRTTYPGAAVGILAMRGVANPKSLPAFDERKAELERRLRSQFSDLDRAALRALPTLQAYHAYYKRFKKTYHVQLQLESVVFKGKAIPRVAALVEAMFVAELKNQLLTAGHDLEVVERPVGIDVADGSERYTRINGQEQQLKKGDMMITDAEGVISSVLYGPDRRTRIGPETQQVLFTTYAVPGIGEEGVWEHLRDIEELVLLIAPQAQVETMEVYGTG
jgi:DNA/RNA-binding domain of Phe-tRNA-synthetase-like protein